MNLSIQKLLAFASLSLFFISCSKSENTSGSGVARLEVYLADAPGDYDSVIVDLREVRINYGSDSASGWQTLPAATTGPVNLLQLVNGNETLLSTSDISGGRIQQIRLLLGSNNYVVLNGQRFVLETPSAQQSGLKLNIHQTIEAGLSYRLLLDFDAGRSIHQTGNGRYMLKPVIRSSFEAVGGSVKGFVTPATARTAVYAIQGTDTVAGTFSSAGSWLIRGLNAGTYNLSFVPDSGYANQIRAGIIVNTGAITVADTVRLR